MRAALATTALSLALLAACAGGGTGAGTTPEPAATPETASATTTASATVTADTTAADTPAGGEASFDGRPLSSWVEDLKAPAPYSRTTAAYAIASMGPAGAPAVPALIPLLKDAVPNVRYPAAIALGEIGPGAKAAIPALQDVVENDISEDVGHVARKAIRKIDPTARVPVPDDD